MLETNVNGCTIPPPSRANKVNLKIRCLNLRWHHTTSLRTGGSLSLSVSVDSLKMFAWIFVIPPDFGGDKQQKEINISAKLSNLVVQKVQPTQSCSDTKNFRLWLVPLKTLLFFILCLQNMLRGGSSEYFYFKRLWGVIVIFRWYFPKLFSCHYYTFTDVATTKILSTP